MGGATGLPAPARPRHLPGLARGPGREEGHTARAPRPPDALPDRGPASLTRGSSSSVGGGDGGPPAPALLRTRRRVRRRRGARRSSLAGSARRAAAAAVPGTRLRRPRCLPRLAAPKCGTGQVSRAEAGAGPAPMEGDWTRPSSPRLSPRARPMSVLRRGASLAVAERGKPVFAAGLMEPGRRGCRPAARQSGLYWRCPPLQLAF